MVASASRSDLALALAWIHVIIYEGLMDQEFVMDTAKVSMKLAEHVSTSRLSGQQS